MPDAVPHQRPDQQPAARRRPRRPPPARRPRIHAGKIGIGIGIGIGIVIVIGIGIVMVVTVIIETVIVIVIVMIIKGGLYRPARHASSESLDSHPHPSHLTSILIRVT